MPRFMSFVFVLAMLLAAGCWAGEETEELSEQLEAVKAIDWNKLATLLPDKVDGMTVGELDGGSMSLADPTNPNNQFTYSAVSKPYSFGEDKTVLLRILDTGFNQFLMMPFAMQMEYDSPEGSVKSAEINGVPVKIITEKDDGKITDMQIIALAAKRILVNAETEDNVTLDEIEKVFKLVDFELLNKMAK